MEIPPADMPSQMSAAGIEINNCELDIISADGKKRHVLGNARPLRDEQGNLRGSISAFIDITERKKAEAKELERNNLRNAFFNLNEIMEQRVESFKYSVKIESSYFAAGTKLKETLDNLEKLVEERTTQLEKAYKSSKESEKGLAEAQKMAHIGNWIWDIATDAIHWSDELYRIFKRDTQKAAPPYNEYLSYVHPDDRDYVDNAFKGTINGKPYNIEHRIILVNGDKRTVHIQAEAVFDEKNIPIRVKGIVQDITERKRAEEKIEILANAVKSSNDAIITESLDGIITSWNKEAEHIYGYSAEEILGKDTSILEPDNLKGEIKKLIDRIKQGIKIKNYETTRLKKDGTLINVSVTLSPVFDASGELVAISAIARDITERINAEKSMAKAEDTRKKEIHHRIKNNLQIISSLLDLQADKFEDENVREAFRESQSRVLSMSLIHEELYKGEGTDTLDFSAYLKKLAENLFQTYSLSSQNIRLYVDLEENASFNMDTVVPLGIIINELVSNSLKHAFQGRDGGEIRIKLRRKENGKCINSIEEGKGECCKSISFILTVSDDGIGIPESLDLENLETLGFQLIASLVDQLDGELKLKRNNGAEFTIWFTVTEINQIACCHPALNRLSDNSILG